MNIAGTLSALELLPCLVLVIGDMFSLVFLMDYVLPVAWALVLVAWMPPKAVQKKSPKAKAAADPQQEDGSSKKRRTVKSKESLETEGSQGTERSPKKGVVDVDDGVHPTRLPREQVKSMLGYLNYQMAAKKATPEHRCNRKKALDVYASLAGEAKVQFLSDFFKNKKNINFISNYQEKVTNTRSESSSYNINLLLRSQILAHNNFDHHKMSEDEIEETLRELLALNHQEFQFEAKVVEHASPAFKKYSYCIGKGTDVSLSHTTEDSMMSSAELNTAAAAALAGGQHVDIHIKQERPQAARHKDCVQVLKAAAAALLKLVAVAEDVMYKLMEQDCYVLQAKEFEVSIETLQNFLRTIRKDVVKNDGLTEKSEEEFKELCDDLDAKKKAALVHQEGMKANVKKYRAFL